MDSETALQKAAENFEPPPADPTRIEVDRIVLDSYVRAIAASRNEAAISAALRALTAICVAHKI